MNGATREAPGAPVTPLGDASQPVSIGPTGREMTGRVPAEDQETSQGRGKTLKGDLPEGVLEGFGKPTLAVIYGVAVGAIAQAGYNLALALHRGAAGLHEKPAGLPLVFAIGFPLMLEGAAATFAWQDIKDRKRSGRVNKEYRAATYATLLISSVINAFVGLQSFGALGFVEVFPPIILGLMIHMHGNRMIAAFNSQNRTRPKWREQHLQKAKTESVLSVLHLLTGNDEDGKASADLLKKRMESLTLSPAQALLDAGYGEREKRGLKQSQIRRLEIVANTVFGPEHTPTPPPVAASSPRAVTPLAARTTSTSLSLATTPRRQPADSSPPTLAASRPSSPSPASEPRRIDEAEFARILAEVRRTKPDAGEPMLLAVLEEKNLSIPRAQMRAVLRATPPGTKPSAQKATDGTTADRAGQS